jgi:hypothetical protein
VAAHDLKVYRGTGLTFDGLRKDDAGDVELLGLIGLSGRLLTRREEDKRKYRYKQIAVYRIPKVLLHYVAL